MRIDNVWVRKYASPEPSASVNNEGSGQSSVSVTFGGVPATHVKVNSSTSISATTPTHAGGSVNVSVTNSDGQMGTLTDGFFYGTYATTPGADASAYYKLDEGYGSSSSDATSNHQNLTLVNSPGWTNSAKFGKGLNFTRSSSQYAWTADSSALSLTSDLTLSAWIKPSSNSSGTLYDIAGKWDGSNESYLLAQYGSELRMYIDSSSNYFTTSGLNLQTGQWYHVAATYSASTQTVKIYVNGAERSGSVTGTIPASIGDDSGRFQLAAEDSSTTATNFFDGTIDEVKVFDSAFNADQIKFDLNGGKAVQYGSSAAGQSSDYCIPGDGASCGSPVGEWKLDEHTGTSANDTSGNNHPGSLNQMDSASWLSASLCKYGSCLAFNGTNQYAHIGTGPSSVKTVEFWVNPATTTEHIIDLNGSAYVRVNSGTISAPGFSSPTIYVNGRATTALAASVWQYVVVTTDTALNASDLDIGRLEGTDYFQGSIDDVKMFDYARTPAQIAWDMNRGKPVGLWKMNETSGSAYDSSGNGNTGTWNGTGTHYSDGKFGNAGQFNGSNDYVDVGNGASLNPQYISVSAWIKTSATGALDQIFSKDNSSGGRVWQFNRTSNGHIGFAVFNASSNSGIEGNTNIADGMWHHVAGTWDGSTIRVYVDGHEDGTGVSFSGTLRSGQTNSAFIGRSQNVDPGYFQGQIDDVRLYNYALTPEQIRQAMNEGSVVHF
jgi:Concanavalin A-like lectin/glucanases superfamily/IPT/TIG domain